MNTDARRHSPAAERNRRPILVELLRLLPASGVMLEIASGTGQHAAHFAAALGGWRWCPSDAEAATLPSIDASCAGLSNVSKAFPLDVQDKEWHGAPALVDAIFNANMLHISPWATCAALMQGAARHLAPRGVLLLYGPFILDDEATAPSNRAFDADLRARNSAWGIRRLAEVQRQAQAAGLHWQEMTRLPANNLLLAFARGA